MRRALSLILVLTILASLCSFGVHAEISNDYLQQGIEVIVDKNGESFAHTLWAIQKDGELYVTAQSLTEITRYQLLEEETRFVYTLGSKSVWIDLAEQTLRVKLIYQPFSGTLLVDGIHYLPLSEMLPWMNVQCYEKDGTIHIDSDPLSYWEVTKDFSPNDHVFNLSEHYGQTTSGVVGLCAISVFDNILDLENIWKKVVVVDDGKTRLYDYEIYKECFREFALPEVGSAAEGQEIISELSDMVSDGSQFLSSYYEAIYTQETYDKIAEQFGEEIAAGLDKMPKEAEEITDTMKKAKEALKYMKTSYLYLRIAIEDTTDYAKALRYIYLREGVNFPSGMVLAASEAIVTLESQAGAIGDAAATILAEVGISALEDYASKAVEETIETVAGDTIFGSLGLYLDIIDASLSLVWPINEAFSDINKMTVYQSIQYDALNAYYNADKPGENVSAQDISNGRTCALIFLKTAKKCYKAQQKTFDLFGAEGVLDYKIKAINEEILKFELTALAEEHDAICDKSKEAAALKELWSRVISFEQPQQSQQSQQPQQPQYDSPYQGEWVSGRISDVLWDRTLTINSIDENQVNFDIEFYRIRAWENLTATIQRDGKITFTISDDTASMSGFLELNDSVTMHITESTFEYIDPEMIVFERGSQIDSPVPALTSGVWYHFAPDADLCEQYTFAADNTYTQKTWEYAFSQTDSENYVYDYSQGSYTAPQTGTYSIDGNGNVVISDLTLTYNPILDRLEGPSGWSGYGNEVEAYMHHYDYPLDALQIHLEHNAFRADSMIRSNVLDKYFMPGSMMVVNTVSEHYTGLPGACYVRNLSLDIPCVFLPGDEVKELNREIYQRLYPYLEDVRSALAQNTSISTIGIFRDAWSDSELLTVRIRCEHAFCYTPEYIVCTVDLDDYSVLSSREVAARFGITDNYEDVIRQVMENYAISMQAEETDKSLLTPMDEILSQYNVDNACFYVGEDGELMLSCNVMYDMAGNEGDYNFCLPVNDYLY